MGRHKKSGATPRHDRTRPDHALLFGLHAVAAALKNPDRTLIRLTASRNALTRLRTMVDPLPIDPLVTEPKAIDRLVSGSVHQGIVLEAGFLPPIDLETLAGRRLVVVLDQITDPQNVGAILRSANAMGADAVITTARHSPEATGTLAKAASGALEWTPYVVVRNLAETLATLGDFGYARIGLDSDADLDLADVATDLGPDRPRAIVLGAEGKGLRRLTAQRCDTLARLDLPGRIKSLNVSNAAVLALHLAGGCTTADQARANGRTDTSRNRPDNSRFSD